MGRGGGRPRDDEAWDHVTKLEGVRVRCNHCNFEFAAPSAIRIKAHISKNKSGGIRICPGSPQSNNFGSPIANSNNDLEDNHGSENYTQGQTQDDGKDQESIQAAGSISVSDWEDEDLQVIRYVSESLSTGDYVFQSDYSNLTQKEFITLVKPETYLDSLVIDAFVEILTDAERKKPTPSNWYLPVMFSTAAVKSNLHDFKDFAERQKMRENYMSVPESPEKVFIPVHIGPQLQGHFYLYIIHLKNEEIEIWDSLPTYGDKQERIEKIDSLLLAMEELFKEKGTFANMRWKMVDDIPSQPNKYDCGIFVIKFMEQSEYYVKINPSFKFDSEKEREDLALKLLKSHLNKEKANLYNKANSHYAQPLDGKSVEKQDDNKRSRVDFDERVKSYDGLPKAVTGKNFQSYVQRIQKWIDDDSVSAIGVWGMGGSGKTALASHIHGNLIERADMKVIWVTVSQNSICRLQEVIARSIKLDISYESDVKRIAQKLFQAFREMERCVVILDDVWDHFSLQEVGFPMSGNQIKLIMTTRIWDVCQGMDCEKNIEVVEPLDGEDSWTLFEKITSFHDGLHLEVKDIARSVAYECVGLPLAIVRIATSMKGKKQAREWSHMLECLEELAKGQYVMDKWVLPVLRSSYDFLNNNLQRFFLYFVLTADRALSNDRANHLIRRFVCESMDETKKLRVQYNEGYNMLDKLKHHTMLDLKQNDDKDEWRVHKFVRVLAFGIAEYGGGIMANAYKNLTKIPRGDRWKGVLQKVFLTGNRLQTIGDGTCPDCSQLSTLLLDCNSELSYISDDFFKNMPALKTLDLSGTGIERLPKSVSNLKCLVALLLSGCSKLMDIPSLSELERLMSFDLSDTSIKAPMGLESLVNLRWLNLRRTDNFAISKSLISKLISLECLELGSAQWLTDVTVRWIQGLKKLEVIEAHFRDVEVFNTCVKFMAKNGVIRCYCLTLRHGNFDSSEGRIDREFCIKRITFEGVVWGKGKAELPRDVNELLIYRCRQGRTDYGCLGSVLSYADHNNNNDAHQIERLDITGGDMEYLCCSHGGCRFCSSSQLIGSLSLSSLADLKSLVSPANADSLRESTLFSHLTNLHVSGCKNMETLMTPRVVACLRNLRTILVGKCDEMKKMVGEDDSETQPPPITLPNLTSLHLYTLPKLKSVYRGIMLCHSLQAFFADTCCDQDHPRIQISKGCMLPMQKCPYGRYSWVKDVFKPL